MHGTHTTFHRTYIAHACAYIAHTSHTQYACFTTCITHTSNGHALYMHHIVSHSYRTCIAHPSHRTYIAHALHIKGAWHAACIGHRLLNLISIACSYHSCTMHRACIAQTSHIHCTHVTHICIVHKPHTSYQNCTRIAHASHMTSHVASQHTSYMYFNMRRACSAHILHIHRTYIAHTSHIHRTYIATYLGVSDTGKGWFR